MELPSFGLHEIPAAIDPLMLGRDAGTKPHAARDPRSRHGTRAANKPANCVLMLGSIRELALYRAEVLRHHGYEVIAPATEAEAFDLIRRAEFDAAVLSYTLPDRTVEEFALALREHCARCPILAIAQTARADRKIAPDAIVIAEKGPPELLAALRRLLRHD